jgi:septal ring factor EnvC (AmiA/AmiB activator)
MSTSCWQAYAVHLLQVLHGGENLLDKVEALKARSAATKAELEVAARQKEEQQRRLEQLQIERLDLNAQYSSVQVSWLDAGGLVQLESGNPRRF